MNGKPGGCHMFGLSSPHPGRPTRDLSLPRPASFALLSGDGVPAR